MAKKELYRVTVTVDLVVAAESRFEAEDEARSIVTCEDGAEPTSCYAVQVASKLDLPAGWDLGCIPFGEDSDREIRDYLPAK